MEGWTFFYMFVILKIPVVAALWLVWWAVHAEPETEDETAGGRGDGGSPHPRRPRPPRPRRGEHGARVPRAPQRMRVTRRRPVRTAGR